MPTDYYRAIELLSRTPYGRVSASRRALPFTTVTRHVVMDDGRLMLRLHRGYNYHQALDGSVVAYEADNANCDSDTWSVQFTGTARVVTPTPAERELFGPTPRLADDAPFDPVFLRIEPELVALHQLTDVPVYRYAHSA
ncbi:hypothetical protein SSP35_03_02530 [Streptomyces sp. NBRC 110611]|uniref:pyridoxamine 5'-phosphate oxidase family protein n=1 Tax=Streptomyces sp. NBRC 110611 TaxID=1621259 RepID=UPI00082FEA1E|nr:pyridoxamine 5'-phosphate oxidase family protein [Streptomyces sp. NBRC 110611]GAU66605.1 hypothetical protein SSP35_03_02530 [Streptomyces sp. NBRC 110611]